MKTQIISGISAIALVAASAWAVAGPGFGSCNGGADGWGPRGGHYQQGKSQRGGGSGQDWAQMQQRKLDRMQQQLSLTDQQRQQVEQLMGQHQPQRSAHQAEMQTYRQQFQQLDPAADDYLNQVEKMAKQRGEAMAQRMMERAKHHAELFAILTPEQQQAFKQNFSQRRMKQGCNARGV